ncbi:MAG: ATP-binding protein, partial [Candidatus Omnitrophica bacterium]|nr:ATP-binding protein [Candidatus Omnitrophota bacterium]
MAQAIGYEAIKAGHTVVYRSIFDVVRELLRAENLGRQDAAL